MVVSLWGKRGAWRAPSVRSGCFYRNQALVSHPAVFAVLVVDLEPDVGLPILIPVAELAHDLNFRVTDNFAAIDVLAAVLRHVIDVE